MNTVRLGAIRARVELTLFARQTDTLFFSFLMPLIMLALFAAVFGHGQSVSDRHGQSIPFPQYFLPGMLAGGIGLVSFQTVAIAVTVERYDGTLKRLATTPLPPAAYFAGKCAMVLAAAITQTALLLAEASLAFGVSLPTSPGRWLAFGWLFVAGTAAGVLLGVAYAALPRSTESVGPVVAGPVLLLQFISGVYFAFPDLPRWLQDVAAIFPLKWIAQGMRSVFLPDGFAALEPAGHWQRGTATLVLLGWAVVGLLLCLRTFRWTRERR